MNVLISHIEYLLTLHDCVILPDFGGFVLRYQEAVFTPDGKITPPCKVTGFNAALTHNDGLLANALMQERNISFSEAMILIETEVRKLQVRLQQGFVEEMGSIGSFQKGEEGILIFKPSRHNSFDLSLFGFSSFDVRPLRNEYMPEPTTISEVKPDVVMVPVNMRILRRVTAVAAMIVGLLLISHPLEHGHISQHYASMISSELLTKAVVPGFSYYQEQIDEAADAHEEPAILPEPAEAEGNVLAEAEVAVVPEVAVVNVTEPQEIQPVKRYYIIIGSFPTAEQAEKRISHLSKKGVAGVQYLQKDSKYRLYINTFSDKTDANQYLEVFREEHPEFADAWLLAHISR